MSLRTRVLQLTAVAAGALALASCGAAPNLPVPALTSPATGASAPYLFDPGGPQFAAVRICSVTGGPVHVDVHMPLADALTEIGIYAYADFADTAGSLEFPGYPIIHPGVPGPDMSAESSRDLAPGECATINISTEQFFSDPGRAFTYRITW
jgi:hypothetical protein